MDIAKTLSKLKKFRWLGIIIALAVAGGFFLSKSNAEKKENSYKTFTAVKGNLENSISASGKITGEEKATLRFQSSGQLAWVGVKEGDFVQKWQALASLDKNTLEKQLRQELIDYENERYDMDEERKDNNISSNQFDGFTMSDNLKYDLLRSQNTLNRTILDVELSSLAMKYATLITPIEGIITKIDTHYAGINITPAGSEFEVVNPAFLIFEAYIDETDIAKINTGNTVSILLDAFPDKKLSGTISFIGFTSTNTSGGGTAFPTKIIPSDTEGLRIGMNGDIDIVTSSKKQVLIVPIEAVREKDQAKYVWQKLDSDFVKTEVETGEENDDSVEILSGLAPEDIVLLSGFSDLEK